MKSGSIKTAAVLLGCLLGAVSCSIKEDRTLCPSTLVMDYALVRSDGRISAGEGRDSMLVSVSGVFSSFVRLSDYPQAQRITVPRRRLLAACHYGLTPSRLDASSRHLVIPPGEDSDRLFSWRAVVEFGPDTEEIVVMPSLCNEFTKVILSFPEEGWDTSAEPYRMHVEGSTCGLDLESGRPIEGPFSYDMDIYDSHSYSFNMPRQAGRDILIDAIDSSTGEALFRFDLGGELSAAGYPWDAVSLPPLVVVVVSMSDLSCSVDVMDWEKAIYFDYEI